MHTAGPHPQSFWFSGTGRTWESELLMGSQGTLMMLDMSRTTVTVTDQSREWQVWLSEASDKTSTTHNANKAHFRFFNQTATRAFSWLVPPQGSLSSPTLSTPSWRSANWKFAVPFTPYSSTEYPSVISFLKITSLSFPDFDNPVQCLFSSSPMMIRWFDDSFSGPLDGLSPSYFTFV